MIRHFQKVMAEPGCGHRGSGRVRKSYLIHAATFVLFTASAGTGFVGPFDDIFGIKADAWLGLAIQRGDDHFPALPRLFNDFDTKVIEELQQNSGRTKRDTGQADDRKP